MLRNGGALLPRDRGQYCFRRPAHAFDHSAGHLERLVARGPRTMSGERLQRGAARVLKLSFWAAKQVLTHRQYAPLRQHQMVGNRRCLRQLLRNSHEQLLMSDHVLAHGNSRSS